MPFSEIEIVELPTVAEADYIEQLCEAYSYRELQAMAEDEQDPWMKRIMLRAAEHG